MSVSIDHHWHHYLLATAIAVCQRKKHLHTLERGVHLGTDHVDSLHSLVHALHLTQMTAIAIEQLLLEIIGHIAIVHTLGEESLWPVLEIERLVALFGGE